MLALETSTWILLRGLIREASHWGQFPALLRRERLAREVVSIDLPGCGAHFQQKSPLSVADLASFVRAKAESHLKLAEGPCFLLGISMGAMVAIDWIQRFKNPFAGTILINTSVSGVAPFFDRLRPHAWPAIVRGLFTNSIEQRERTILKLVSCHPNEDVLRDWIGIQNVHPVSKKNFLRQVLAAAKFRPSLAPPKQPVLLIASRGDRLVKVSCSQKLASVWNVPLEIHPFAGHDLPLDDPRWLCENLLHWCSSL